jgi:hypothetical protein
MPGTNRLVMTGSALHCHLYNDIPIRFQPIALLMMMICCCGYCPQVFPLSEVAEAHKQVESGHTRGKVVLAIT